MLADSARFSRSATDRSLHMRTAQGLADEVNDALTHPMIRKPAYFTSIKKESAILSARLAFLRLGYAILGFWEVYRPSSSDP
jgi:hypothetical protein